ncbi:MAG: AAA family ATPase [Roseiarcus sp.]|jgi:predicted ATPase
MQITNVKIEKFKRITSLEVNLSDITIIIGGNNSGKSSLLQGIHWAITTLQSAISASTKSKPASTLGVDQFIYRPTTEPIKLYHNGDMTSKNGPSFSFTYKDTDASEPKLFALSMRRGKNANIALIYERSNTFFKRASDRTRPLSIFVPGLAGIALNEEKRTDAIITTGIAQGDANLYLRNVLYRLTEDKTKLEKFHTMISEIFPGLQINCVFNEKTNTYINIIASLDAAEIPLEIVGSGTLQAIQLVAYTTMYEPALLILDEPDAHLHPSNQRALAATLLKIAEQGSPKIVLATHSRHMFDSLASSELTEIVWLKNGQKQENVNSMDLSILLDLGALDSFELSAGNSRRVVILTEDTKSKKLAHLLEANGFRSGEYFLQTYNGVRNIGMTAGIADFFVKQGDDTHVVVHRDGDCMLEKERAWYLGQEAGKLPERSLLFITGLSDIEHYYCDPRHVAASVGISVEAADRIVSGVLEANNASLAAEFGAKRKELIDRDLRGMNPEPLKAADLLGGVVRFEQAKGKRLFGLLVQELTKLGHNPMKLTNTKSDALNIPELRALAEKVWPPKPNGSN